jgi:predicted phosphodiesterase
MRCHYLSDLHLEAQAYLHALPEGDVLILAGDICNAVCLLPDFDGPSAQRQRDRVLALHDAVCARFPHVLMVAGNHEHYGGRLDLTVGLLRRHLPGFTVLDDEAVVIGGVRFWGGTLWSDLDGGDPLARRTIERQVADYRAIAVLRPDETGEPVAERLRPCDTLAAHGRAVDALGASLAVPHAGPTVVITHYAPSHGGRNPYHVGNGLDGAFASDLDGLIAALTHVPVWVHGHTHIARTYRVGATTLRVNCHGFPGRDIAARRFDPGARFDVRP